jgi:hypothetical protein
MFGNVSTYVILRIQPADAALFQGEIPVMADEWVRKRNPKTDEMEWTRKPIPFDTNDLTGLGVGRALYRAADESAGIINLPPPPPPLTPTNARITEYIKKRTLQEYGSSTSEKKLPSEDASADDFEPTQGERKPVPRHRDETQGPVGNR